MIAYRTSAEAIVAIDLTMPLARLTGCRARAFVSGTCLPCHCFVSQPISGRETNNPEASNDHSEQYALPHAFLLRNELVGCITAARHRALNVALCFTAVKDEQAVPNLRNRYD